MCSNFSVDNTVEGPAPPSTGPVIAPESPDSVNPDGTGSLLVTSCSSMASKPRLPNMGISITRGSDVGQTV